MSCGQQNTDKEQWRKPPQYWETQDKNRLYCWCRRKHEIKVRRRWTQTSSRSHHCKRDEFCDSLQSCSQIHSDASSVKNSRCKGSSGEIMGKNWRKSQHGSWRKSETRKRWSMKQRLWAEKFISRHWWICVISRIRSWKLSIKSTKAGRTPMWHCKRWFWFVCSVHWTRIISISSDSRKSHGHYIKASGMFRTGSRCSFRLYSGQNGRCSIVIENSKVRLSSYLDTSTIAQMVKIMVQCGRPSRCSRKESVRSPSGRTLMWKAIWESSTGTRLGKVLNWECLYVHREKGLFLSVYVDDIKFAGKKHNIDPMWPI